MAPVIQPPRRSDDTFGTGCVVRLILTLALVLALLLIVRFRYLPH